MSEQKAKNIFLGKNGEKKMNCAQAIAVVFEEKFDLDKELVIQFKAYGGGRAPEGYCGAFYAARHILEKNHPEKLKSFDDFFISHAGYKTCKEIKKITKTSCEKCVEISAHFIKQI